jgi:hypothetical protein
MGKFCLRINMIEGSDPPRGEEDNTMRNGLAVVIALFLSAGLARAEDLKRLSLDSPSSVSPKIESDAKVKVEGQSSIKITSRWPTTVCLDEVVGLDVENARLVYSAKVKTDLDGAVFLEMWAHVGGGEYFSKGMNDLVTGESDWKTIRTPFIFQKGQRPDKVTLNLVINGKGTVWIDDIVLSKESLN